MFTRWKHPLHQQGPDPPTPERGLLHVTTWLWEALSFSVSMLCIGGILVVLAHFDQKPVPDLGWLTINGIIGTLAGVAKAALILPLSEAISQLKWIWFWDEENPKPLSDFQLYDSASRGPWGSLCLLIRPRLVQLASLGALLTVLALAMETFLQLIPTYPVRMMPLSDHIGTIGIARNYKERIRNAPTWEFRTAPTGFKGAFNAAMYESSAASRAIVPQCPTANCTWTPYSTLAVCSSCTNLSSIVERSVYTEPYITFGNLGKQTATYVIPQNGFSLNGVPEVPASAQPTAIDQYSYGIAAPGNWSVAYKPYENMSILDAFPMYWPAGDYDRLDVTPALFECVLYFCINTYTAAVSSGRLIETLHQSWPDPKESMPDSLSEQISAQGIPPIPKDLDGFEVEDAKLTNSSLVFRPPGANGTVYTVDWLTLDGLRSWLSTVWRINTGTWDRSDVEDLSFSMYTTGRREASKPTKPSAEEARRQLAVMPGPEQLWLDVAESLTTYIRTAGRDFAEGETLAGQAFVSARWEWAILPMSLLGLALFFVITTVVISARKDVPLWKSNSLPPLLYGLDTRSTESIVGCCRSAETMEKHGRQHKMSMSRKAEILRMMVRSGAKEKDLEYNDAVPQRGTH